MKPTHYLEGLNSLRFVAAALVLLGHSEHHLKMMGIPFGEGLAILGQAGKAVDFFFVLSGFLLTYLTLSEIMKQGRMNLRFFYIRRVLRIMPLYYLVLFGTLFLHIVLVPRLTGESMLGFPPLEGGLLFGFMLPNLVSPIWPDTAGGINLLWSIGVEEQFYLLFPFIIYLIIQSKRKIATVFALLLAYTAFYWAIQLEYISTSDIFRAFARSLRFHFMLAGMLLAVLIHPYSRINEKIEALSNHFALQIGVSLLVLFELFFAWDIAKPIQHIYLSLLFSFVILITSRSAKKRWFAFEMQPFAYWGTISYGIYLLHPLTSYILRFFIQKIAFLDALIHQFPILYVLFLLAGTILVAHISYQYYELRFLKLKDRFR